MSDFSWRSIDPALVLVLTSLSMITLGASVANAQQRAPSHACGPLHIAGHYGPFDYRTERNRLEIVENFHYTPRVEALISGQSGSLEQDLNYTLKSSPNHHRALLSLSRYTLRAKDRQPAGFEWPLECYFERAVRFKGDDPVVRMIYAQFLGQTKRVPAASAQLDVALTLGAESAFTQYNAGLIFLEMGDFERALTQAHRASGLGLKNPDLETKLRQAGRWRDAPQNAPTPGANASAASAATASASSANPSSANTSASSASAPSN